MDNEASSSMQTECSKRLTTLYNQHHKWLGAVAFNISKNKDTTDELVSELYLYLSEKCNHKLFYLDSYNLQYCRSFMMSRFLNKVNREKKPQELKSEWDAVSEEYDEDRDRRVDIAYAEVLQELDRMKKRKGFASAMIYEHYWFSDKTLDEVSKDIGISKSTTFLSVKAAKQHLKNNIQNPFENDK